MFPLKVRSGQASREARGPRNRSAPRRRRADVASIVRPIGQIFRAFSDRPLTSRGYAREGMPSAKKGPTVARRPFLDAFCGSEPLATARNRVEPQRHEAPRWTV